MILLRPVVDTLLKAYSDVIIWIVSDQKNESLFNHDSRIKFIGVDLNNNILQILRQVRTASNLTYFNGIYDLHNVIRSQFIRFFLKNKTQKISVYLKERSRKKKIVQKKIKLIPLKHTTERYLDCLKIDFPEISFNNILQSLSIKTRKEKIIGVAPFSAHSSKQWGLENYNYIFEKYNDYKFKIFAFGDQEKILASKKFSQNDQVAIISDKMEIKEQIELINKCCVFISMDSANMHLASLTSTPVVSVWGPTHPFLGFGPLFNDHLIVQLNDLPCRPCSVYGKVNSNNLDCAKKSMTGISSEMVIDKLELALNN